MIKHIFLILTILMLSGCAVIEQRIVIVKCLALCKDGDAACINACGNLLNGECH